MECYYAKLNTFEKKHYCVFLKAMQRGDSSVTAIGVYQIEQIQRIVNAINYDHPELFFVNFRIITGVASPIGFSLNIRYLYSTKAIAALCRQVDNTIDRIISELRIKPDESIVNRCRKLHNYLIAHVKYNYETMMSPDDYLDNFTAYGALVNQEAVCEGISKAFVLLSKRLGVDACLVSGISSRDGFGNQILHAWNIVKIESEYAHIDVTWDLGATNESGATRYDYFMIPDQWIQCDHEYDILFPCNTYKYSYFSIKGKICNGVQALKRHLDKEMQGKSNEICFKLIGDGFPDDIDNRVHSLVEKAIDQHWNSAYSLQMGLNHEQHVFFYRITTIQ